MLRIILVAIAATVVVGQSGPWCSSSGCSQGNNDQTCPGIGYAFGDNLCHFEGCPCGITPPNPNVSVCPGPDEGKTSCPKDCGPAGEWIMASDGCPSCVCWRDNPVNAKLELEKEGTCPPYSRSFNSTTGFLNFVSNTPRGEFNHAPRCEKDLDCRGIKKCCDFSLSIYNRRCVYPEPQCPTGGRFRYGGKICVTNADCDYGDACCSRGFGSKRCMRGVLPEFPPIRYTGRVDGIQRSVPSPAHWA